MLVEGHDELALALEGGARTAELFYCPALIRSQSEWELLARVGQLGAAITEVDERPFRKMAYRQNPDGWLAMCALPPRAPSGLQLGWAPLLLVAESVEKPGNLGALLRTADAAGVDAVISCEPQTDWGNPNVVRASKGALFTVQIAEAPNEQAIAWLRSQDIQIVVATPEAPETYTEVDLRGPTAIVVGTESKGVSATWLKEADRVVAIPMAGRANSLNVATAAALMIYEALRQRAGPPTKPASGQRSPRAAGARRSPRAGPARRT